MNGETKRFVLATATLVGTIIGVGIFGIPYALSQAGLLVGIGYFVLLGGIQLLQHLFYAEATIACPEKLRMGGLAAKYLGRRAGLVAAVSTICGFWGGMLAYMIVGGTFLHLLLSPVLGGTEFQYQFWWSLGAAVLVYFGLDVVSRINFIATIGLFVAMLVIFAMGLPHVRLENLPLFVNKDLFLPYGIILFSLSGATAIPEMEDIFKGRHAHYRRSIVLGTLISAALTAAFGFIVWGVTGPATTDAAVEGLKSVVGSGIAVVGAVFGFLAVATSFFATALNLQSTFRYDVKLSRPAAWLCTGAVPFGILLAGAKNFVPIVSFSGAVFGGIASLIIALLYIAVTKRKLVKERPLGLPLGFAYASIAILAVGAVWEVMTTAKDLFG